MSKPLARRIPLRVRQAIVRAMPTAVWERISPAVHGETGWQQAAIRGVAAAAVRGQRRQMAGGSFVPLRTGGRAYLARVVDRFTAADAFDGNLALVAERLTSAGLPFAVVSARPNERRVIAVADRYRPAVVETLSTPPADRALYLGRLRDRRLAEVVPSERSRGATRLQGSDVLRAFEVLAAPTGTLLAGPGYGCDIEFWLSDEDGGLTAPRPNRHAVHLPKDHQEPASVQLGSQSYPTHPAFLVRHAFDVTFPIDIVYTWVDGSDPAWQARKHAAWEQVSPGTLSDLSANPSRYHSRDELRYSLRSVEMYADWVRRIFIVTDDQVPPWLDVNHPRIHMVSHREIFGSTGRLPTFNSHAIESRLHHIDGLSEHYLYLNDDVFLGRPVTPETFFYGSGLSKFFLSKAHVALGEPSPDDLPVTSAGKNNRELLRDRFGAVVTNKFKHVPHPQQRTLLEEMEGWFPGEFAHAAGSQFRHPDDISVAAALHHYCAWFTKRAVPGDIQYYYADIGAPETAARLRRLLRERNYDVFCLNDHDSGHVDVEVQTLMVREFLDAYFSLRSGFELPG